MQQTRRFALSMMLAAAVFCSAPVPGFGDPKSDKSADGAVHWMTSTECTQNWSFAAQPGQKLLADVDRGNVHITTWDQPKVKIVVRHKGSDAAEVVKHHQITVEQSNGEIHLVAKSDTPIANSVQVNGASVTIVGSGNVVTVSGTNGSTQIGSQADIDYEIQLPARFDTTVNNHAGNVEAENLSGTLDLKSDAGNVTTRNLAGKVRLTSAAGNVTSARSNGTLELKSNAGNVEATDFNGESFTADSAAGNVWVELCSQPKQDCSCHSAAGNVTLTLIKTAAVTLHPTTHVGNVQSAFDNWSVNGGGPQMRLDSSVGNVQILAK